MTARFNPTMHHVKFFRSRITGAWNCAATLTEHGKAAAQSAGLKITGYNAEVRIKRRRAFFYWTGHGINVMSTTMSEARTAWAADWVLAVCLNAQAFEVPARQAPTITSG